MLQRYNDQICNTWEVEASSLCMSVSVLMMGRTEVVYFAEEIPSQGMNYHQIVDFGHGRPYSKVSVWCQRNLDGIFWTTQNREWGWGLNWSSRRYLINIRFIKWDRQRFCKNTWKDKEKMLSRCGGCGPVSVERDEDKHEALSMEWRPTEKEREHNNNYDKRKWLIIYMAQTYQAFGSQFFYPEEMFWKRTEK